MSDEVRDDLKYTETHEWVKVEGDVATVGITDRAQHELTDIVFVELPDREKEIAKGDEICVVESVKSVSEIYSPVSGKVLEVNDTLGDSPEIINASPYEDGWLAKIKLTDLSELDALLDAGTYKSQM